MADAGDMLDTSREVIRLAHEAVAQLRLISSHASPSVNQSQAVQAAIMIDEVLRLLRGRDSGRAMILELLESATPEAVSSDVLRHASGIQEFARRIRELRNDGHDIRSTGDGYRLVGQDALGGPTN